MNKISPQKLAQDYSGYPVSPSLTNELETIKSSYIAGVIFMLFVMALLLYVNLYYEYCFRDTIIEMSDTWACSCLKHCFVVQRGKKQNNAANQNHSSYSIQMKHIDVEGSQYE